MSASSEEEIYKRRKKYTEIKEDLENLFEDENEESSEVEYKYNEEHVLVEIFGTGHEYDYIYKTDEPKMKINNESETIQSDYNAKFYCYEDDIFTFLLRRSNYNEIEKKGIKLLLQGYSIFYVFFHCELCLDIKSMNDIKKRISEYVKIKRSVDEGINIGYLENFEEFQRVVEYRKEFYEEENNYSILFSNKYILTVEELYENVTNHEETNIFIQPEIAIEAIVQGLSGKESFTRESFVHRISTLYSKHPIFIKLIVNYGEEAAISFFVGRDDFSDIRSKIIHCAIENIKNLARLREKHELTLLKHDAKDKVTKTCMDIILNGGRPINQSECIFGVYESKNQFYVSVVDHKGKCLEYFILKTMDLFDTKIDTHAPVYIVFASLEKTIRFIIPKLKEITKCDIIVIDNKLTYNLYGLKDLRKYTINLAKRVMWPEIELCKIKKNNIKLFNDECTKILDKEEYFEAMDLGIKIGLSYIGVDINMILCSDFKLLLPYIGLDAYFIKQIDDYGEIPSIKVLKDMGLLLQINHKDNAILLEDPVNNFDNSCVFLRCYKDFLLDHFMIHPKNYGYAKVLASAALNEETIEDPNPIIKKVQQNPDKVSSFDMSAIAQTGNSEMINIRNYLLIQKRDIFAGVTDETIFFEILGLIKEKEYEGQVKKIDNGYLIATICPTENDYLQKPIQKNHTVDVFVKTDTSNYFSNQYINVKVEYPAFSNLSYTGHVIEKKKPQRLRFVDSSWFRNLNCQESEKYLTDNNKTILLRPSSRDENICVFTVKLLTNPPIFVHLKLKEFDSHYDYNGMIYDDTDEFASRYIRKMIQMVKKIKENKHYSRTKENALANLLLVNYVLYLSEQYPGRLILAYKNGNKIAEEYIKIEDKLIYESKAYETLDQFITFRLKNK